MSLSAFQQSFFLQSLGWAITNSIWQAGILWLVYQVIIASYNSASAKFKNGLSTTLLFISFVWFIVSLFDKVIYLNENAPGIKDQLFYSINTSLSTGNINFHTIISSIDNLLPYLSLAYLLLLLIFAIKWINSYRNTSFIKNNGLSKPDAEWKLFVEKVANHICINKKIKIWFSKYVDVPSTIGYLKPVILIPLASLNQLSSHQMEAILLHEISHIKRNDYLVNLFVSLAETILFFNPFVVLFSKITKKERENCCDDFVLQYQYDPHSYASALLMLEQSREKEFRLALNATSGRQQLLHRIKRIMQVKNNNDGLNYGQKLLALLLCTGIICSVALIAPQKKVTQNPDTHLQSVQVIKDQSLATTIKAQKKLLSSRHSERKNIPLPISPQILKDRNIIPETPEAPVSTESGEKNPFMFNFKNAEINDRTSTSKVFDKAEQNGQDLKSSFDVKNDFVLSLNALLPGFKFLDNMHVKIDFNNLKQDIENAHQAISLIDWQNLKTQLNGNLEKLKDEKNKYQLKADKLIKDIRLKNVMSQLRTDSIIFPNDIDEDPIYIDDNNSRPKNYIEPTAPVKKDKGRVKVAPPVPGKPLDSYKYFFQYTSPPKVKLPSPPSIHVDYNGGTLIVNGEKISFPELKKNDVEKLIKKLVVRDDKQINKIQLND